MLVGYLPTQRLAGPEGSLAMVLGCTIGALASAVGGLPLLLVQPNTPPSTTASYALAAMGVRFALALGLALAAAKLFADWLVVKPLLLWVALSYIVLLGFDILFAMQALQISQRGNAPR
jgi:hypothetical protein